MHNLLNSKLKFYYFSSRRYELDGKITFIPRDKRNVVLAEVRKISYAKKFEHAHYNYQIIFSYTRGYVFQKKSMPSNANF